MIYDIIAKWWRARRLRIAQEKHAMWKARLEACREMLEADRLFSGNPYNRHQAIKAAGEAARYEERVEYFMRNL